MKRKDGKTTWYLSMLELKLVANKMAISIMNEMIKNEDKRKENKCNKANNEKYSRWIWITNREITRKN